MHRSFGTYLSRMIAKSGKSENGQIAVNSGISNSIQISLPTNSYANVSSGYNPISSRGVGLISRFCKFSGCNFTCSDIILFRVHREPHSAKITHSMLCLELCEKVDEDPCGRICVLIRTMMIQQRDAVVFGERLQFVIFDVGQKLA